MSKYTTNYNDSSSAKVGFGRDYQRSNRYERAQKIKSGIGKPKVANTEKKEETLRIEDKAVAQKIDSLMAKYLATYGVQEEAELREYVAKHNLDLKTYDTRDVVDKNDRDNIKSKISRMTFNGVIDKPVAGFSYKFKKILDEPSRFEPIEPSAYNMADSTVWQVFSQVPEFASMEGKIKEALGKMGVHPQFLPQMKLNDFKHILFEHCSVNKGLKNAHLFPVTDKEGNIKTEFVNGRQKVVTTSPKQKNVKRFIEQNKAEFREMLLKRPGIDKKYVEALIEKMLTTGLTDMSRELRNHPEWSNQPAFNMHHIINIKDCRLLEAQGKSFADINKYDNMCMVYCGTLQEVLNKSKQTYYRDQEKQTATNVHDAIHSADSEIKLEGTWGEAEDVKIADKSIRLEPKQGIKCMMSFNDNGSIYDKKHLEREKRNKRSNNFVEGRE